VERAEVRVAVYLALVLALVVGPAGRLAARRLAPRPSALALVAVATCSAACWLWALSLLAVTLVHQAPEGTDRLFSSRMSEDPVPTWVALAAALLLGAAGGRLLDALSREVRRARAIQRAVSACGRGRGELLVIADPVPQAFAVPSLLRQPGCIVVSTAMLRALDAEERAVLLAHERSHLRNRHSWLRTTVALAAALQPILGRIGDQLDGALERWADEDAVTVVSSRRIAARSLGQAALATLRLSPRGDGALGGPRRTPRLLPTRVAALLDEAPRSQWLPAVATGVLVVLMAVSAAEAGHDLEALFDPGSHTSAQSLS
jgi:Zn-dependent protease with chaperone function